MHIVEIFCPGTWLDLEDQEVAFELQNMLRCLSDFVVEAAVSLTLFEKAFNKQTDSILEQTKNIHIEWAKNTELKGEIDSQLRMETDDLFNQNPDKFNLEVDRRVRARKAALGIVPMAYSHSIPFIYAHSFLYAVDSFGKFLDALCESDEVPKKVSNQRDKFYDNLPTVKKIRNSALHIEDRLRRYASHNDKKKGKKMKLKKSLSLSNLEGNKLCYTIDDGSVQCIAISETTLSELVKVTNNVLTSFKWKGPPQMIP